MAITRVVHRVRCRKPSDPTIWADVKVVDGFDLIMPNGTERFLSVRAKDSVPFIRDETGGGHGKGSASTCTRVSHMELVVGSEDPKQRMYVEILDGMSFNPPTHRDANEHGKMDENYRRGGMPRAAVFGRGDYAIGFKAEGAYVVDKVGLGLSAGSPGSASRIGHISLVTDKGNTDDHTAEADAIPPTSKMTWVPVVKPDAVAVRVPGGELIMSIAKSAQDERDTTVMTTDPKTGDPCPPDNTDPNVYVAFPEEDSVGVNIKIPTTGKPIDQGPLWWIERVSPGGFNPWFWFADINVPRAFSYFGNPGRLGAWAWRGFVLWNYYPVLWILSRNNALTPMGSFGSPSLELCARIGQWDFSYPPVPSEWMRVPSRPPESIAQVNTSQLVVLGAIFIGAAQLDQVNVASPQNGPFGPWGVLQMTHPPLGPLPDAIPYGISIGGNDGSQIWSGRPNIWQLTGLPQPARNDPTKSWNSFTNPYKYPTVPQAEAAARLFKSNWNAVSNGHNSAMDAFVPGGNTNPPLYTIPPGWNWAVPWYDPTAGATTYGASFQNSLPYGIATRAFAISIYAPATAMTIDVDQLRTDWWDTTHIELTANPLNAFFPLITPPFLWSNDPWTGTNIPRHDNPLTGP